MPRVGVTTRTFSQPAARSALVTERMPPSMSRRPFTVTGGQTPGTAQLAVTASSSRTPEDASKGRNSPSAVSTAVIDELRRGPLRVADPALDDGPPLGLGHGVHGERERAQAGPRVLLAGVALHRLGEGGHGRHPVELDLQLAGGREELALVEGLQVAVESQLRADDRAGRRADDEVGLP